MRMSFKISSVVSAAPRILQIFPKLNSAIFQNPGGIVIANSHSKIWKEAEIWENIFVQSHVAKLYRSFPTYCTIHGSWLRHQTFMELISMLVDLLYLQV